MVKAIKELLKYRLEPEDLEERFRLQKLPHDKVQAITVITITLVIIIGFIFLDYQFLQSGMAQYASVTSRCVAVMVSLLAAWMVFRQSVIRSFDIILLSWVIVVIFHMLIVGEVRPGDYVTLVAWDILVIFAIYISLPLPLSLQVLAALVLTTGSAVLCLAIKPPVWSSFEVGATLAAYFVSNAFGIYLSSRFKRLVRNQYVLYMQEQDAKEGLEKAMSEVRVLRGIIPICSFCKKIRNDQGNYEALEAYIGRHSEAGFSHTYCPECAKVHYPDLHEQDSKEQDQPSTASNEYESSPGIYHKAKQNL